jgi:hypothetical protein
MIPNTPCKLPIPVPASGVEKQSLDSDETASGRRSPAAQGDNPGDEVNSLQPSHLSSRGVEKWTVIETDSDEGLLYHIWTGETTLPLYCDDKESVQEICDAHNASLSLAEARAQAGDKFKAFVHSYLTQHGVPEGDPNNQHQIEGCRIGARLDLLLARLAEAERKLEALAPTTSVPNATKSESATGVSSQ